jgi:hypothetical protein
MARIPGLSFLLLVGSLALASAAPTFSITLFEHKDFQGRSLTYTEASPNLQATGLNDRISSLKVVPGQKWLLCKNKKFKGGCIVVDRDVPDLEPLGYNDKISSLKPVE